MKTAIFLGAGASASEKAPLQRDFFNKYFESTLNESPGSPLAENIAKEVASFFKTMFSIEVNRAKDFPTFEEVLGLIDLAEARGESFINLPPTTLSNKEDRLAWIRQCFVWVMAKAIDHCLGSSNDTLDFHKKLVNNLRRRNLLQETTFVSSNYDILIDNALVRLYDSETKEGIKMDYGVEFTNFEFCSDDKWCWVRPNKQSVKLFKLHGSLNWLYCPNCNTLTLTPKIKGAILLITNPEEARCKYCKAIMLPILIPPTYFKNMSNVFLSNIWNKTESALRGVNHVIFCGYSFPDADIHIKYLMKRIQTNREAGLNVVVINNYPGKKDEQKKEEENRYKRFFGKDCVNYTSKSFEEFAENPMEYFREKRNRLSGRPI